MRDFMKSRMFSHFLSAMEICFRTLQGTSGQRHFEKLKSFGPMFALPECGRTKSVIWTRSHSPRTQDVLDVDVVDHCPVERKMFLNVGSPVLLRKLKTRNAMVTHNIGKSPVRHAHMSPRKSRPIRPRIAKKLT